MAVTVSLANKRAEQGEKTCVYDSVDIHKPSRHGRKAYSWRLQKCTNLQMFATFLSKKLMETADLMVGFSSGLPGKFASMV